MNSAQMEERLVTLLAEHRPSTGRATLVTGPWGCGKTYLWNNVVVPKLGRPHIYVSAFGAESAQQFRTRLLTHLVVGAASRAKNASETVTKRLGFLPWTKNADKKPAAQSTRVGETIRSALNAYGSSLLRKLDLDPLELAGLVEPETIICIDDIERISSTFKIEEFLGIANILAEHKKFDLVLICNEDALITGEDKERAKQYSLYKEKVIFHAFHLATDVPIVYDRIVESMAPVGEVREELALTKPALLAPFATSGSANLRALSRVLSCLDMARAAKLPSLTEDQLRALSAIALDSSDSGPKPADFYNFNDFAIRASEQMSKKEPSPTRSGQLAFMERYFGEASYLFDPGVVELVQLGTIDKEKFTHTKPVPVPTEFDSAMKAVHDGKWRWQSDAKVSALLQSLCSHLHPPSTLSARQLLEGLAYARFLAGVADLRLPDGVETSVMELLRERARAGDKTVSTDWGVFISGMQNFISGEFEEYRRLAGHHQRQAIADELRPLLSQDEPDELIQALSRTRIDGVRVLLEDLGLDSLWAIRTSRPHTFSYAVELLVKELPAYIAGGIWPGGQKYMDDIRKRLEKVASNPAEQKMDQWRATALLKRFPRVPPSQSAAGPD